MRQDNVKYMVKFVCGHKQEVNPDQIPYNWSPINHWMLCFTCFDYRTVSKYWITVPEYMKKVGKHIAFLYVEQLVANAQLAIENSELLVTSESELFKLLINAEAMYYRVHKFYGKGRK